MIRQLLLDLYAPHKINENNWKSYQGLIEETDKFIIYLNGEECTTAIRANSVEGWVELMIILNIEKGMPMFGIEGDSAITIVLHGDVRILKRREG